MFFFASCSHSLYSRVIHTSSHHSAVLARAWQHGDTRPGAAASSLKMVDFPCETQGKIEISPRNYGKNMGDLMIIDSPRNMGWICGFVQEFCISKSDGFSYISALGHFAASLMVGRNNQVLVSALVVLPILLVLFNLPFVYSMSIYSCFYIERETKPCCCKHCSHPKKKISPLISDGSNTTNQSYSVVYPILDVSCHIIDILWISKRLL